MICPLGVTKCMQERFTPARQKLNRSMNCTTATRNTFDISAIPVVKKLSHLPIIADPSHGAGRRDMVAPMARAAVAAGADGLIIEVHCDPDHALSDGAQSMFPAQFDRLMAELRIIAPAIGRSICLEPVTRRGWGS